MFKKSVCHCYALHLSACSHMLSSLYDSLNTCYVDSALLLLRTANLMQFVSRTDDSHSKGLDEEEETSSLLYTKCNITLSISKWSLWDLSNFSLSIAVTLDNREREREREKPS